jgi:hypothetical protein
MCASIQPLHHVFGVAIVGRRTKRPLVGDLFGTGSQYRRQAYASPSPHRSPFPALEDAVFHCVLFPTGVALVVLFQCNPMQAIISRQ